MYPAPTFSRSNIIHPSPKQQSLDDMTPNAPKPTRSAACEPCRYNKQSCDHEKPVCSRCIRRGIPHDCAYRDRPFKKRKLVQTQTPATSSTSSASAVPRDEANGVCVPDLPRYPNPGYQGTSSHVAIFEQLPCHVEQEHTPISTATTGAGGAVRSLAHCYRNRNQGEQIMEDCLNKLDLYRLSALISFWLATDTNLGALGGYFVPGCVKAVEDNLLVPHQDDMVFASALAAKLTINSKQPLKFDGTSTFQKMKHELCGEHIRWETLVITLVAGGRAAADIRFFPPLYKDDTERDELQKLLSRLAERCLESAVSLDCVNDFLLISQYENFILYTVLFGDQSFDAWRRLGDVISSLLFLGYNEDIKCGPTCPPFLAELRRNCFAQIYLADKELSLFLGRPPRLNRAFCCFQVPRISPELADQTTTPVSGAFDWNNEPPFKLDEEITFCTVTKWVVLCSMLKERTLEVLRKPQRGCGDETELEAILEQATTLWATSHQFLQLEERPHPSRQRSSFELDFLFNARLTYLQVLFLLHRGNLQQPEPAASMHHSKALMIAKEMLSLVVECIVLREGLVNSGCSLNWTIVQYGLPAAGFVALSLLRNNRPGTSNSHSHPGAKFIQDLCVFVSEVQAGGVVTVTEPNFALLSRATASLQSLLTQVLAPPPEVTRPSAATAQELAGVDLSELPFLDEHLPLDFWTNEEDFWGVLGEQALAFQWDGIGVEGYGASIGHGC